MDNATDRYKSNSHRSKEVQKPENLPERKPVEKVIKGTAKVKKKSELHKFTDIFLPGDVTDVKSYIIADVLIPTIKKAIRDIVSDGIEMLLYPGGVGRPGKNSSSPHISYNRFYDRGNDRDRGRDYRSSSGSYTRSSFNFDDIVLETRGEAEEVLTRMDELIDMYQVVSVADLYDLVGVTGNYTDNKYGWTNLRNASVARAMGGGYILRLPRAVLID